MAQKGTFWERTPGMAMAVVCCLILVDLFKAPELLSTYISTEFKSGVQMTLLNSKPAILLSCFGGLHSLEGPSKCRLALGEILHRGILL